METPNPVYEKHTKAQREALGRFIEAFEWMVHQARFTCIILPSRGSDQQPLLSVAFHHSSLTAKPLFEIARAMIAEIIFAQKSPFSTKQRDTFMGVLAQIADNYFDLANKRNELVHGTWVFGLGEDHSSFQVVKFTASKRGLTPVSLPKNPEHLLYYATRCEQIMHWILITGSFALDSSDTTAIERNFRHNGDKWVRITSDGDQPLLDKEPPPSPAVL